MIHGMRAVLTQLACVSGLQGYDAIITTIDGHIKSFFDNVHTNSGLPREEMSLKKLPMAILASPGMLRAMITHINLITRGGTGSTLASALPRSTLHLGTCTAAPLPSTRVPPAMITSTIPLSLQL